ncbi:MAG: DUF1501 domain-containing protein, partial [Planctomycetales bacterium]|nr:DUF1501 domain-containing protein [Planctomycetales bacterium]
SSISADGPTFLGAAYAPFETSGQARNNLKLSVDSVRFNDRTSVLTKMDGINRQIDGSGLMDGLDSFEQQAASLVLGESQAAFDLKQEDPQLVAKYGTGLGQQLLLARRLCEAGAGFVTINYGGWDMHGNIAKSLTSRAPQLDQGVAALLEDLHDRGMEKNVLLVITGEFGRTPKVNKGSGRDHWAPLSTLALAGGGLRMGQTVGESAPKVDVPATTPVQPLDLLATVFHVLGIPQNLQYVNNSGRPVFINTGGAPIAELI